MKLILVISILLLFSISITFSQKQLNKVDLVQSDTTIYTSFDSAPEFPGGGSLMLKFVRTNFNYPEQIYPLCANPTGKIYYSFVVEKNGSVSNITLVKKINYPEMETELVRVINLFPKFKPAKRNKSAVRARLFFGFNIEPR